MMESDSLPNTSFPLPKSEFIGPKNAELTSLTIGQYFKRVVDNYTDQPLLFDIRTLIGRIKSTGFKSNE